MDMPIADEQRMLLDLVSRFVERELMPLEPAVGNATTLPPQALTSFTDSEYARAREKSPSGTSRREAEATLTAAAGAADVGAGAAGWARRGAASARVAARAATNEDRRIENGMMAPQPTGVDGP